MPPFRALLALAALALPFPALGQEPPALAGQAVTESIERSLSGGFLMAADDGAYFGHILRVMQAGCMLEVFRSDDRYVEEVRLDLRRIGDLSTGLIDMSTLSDSAAGAWVEVSAEGGAGPSVASTPLQPHPLTWILWPLRQRPDSSPDAVMSVPAVRFAIWGTVADIRSKTDALHRALRRAATGCGARPT